MTFTISRGAFRFLNMAVVWSSYEHFFDLSSFEHSAIFKDDIEVWKVIFHLKNYLLEKSKNSTIHHYPGVFFDSPETIVIGSGTTIEPHVYIKGPAIIGKNCEIRHGAYIRGPVLIGDGCIIGHTTEVKNSLFLNGAKAAHFAFIGDSIIGNNVNLGAGVKCANLRLDNQSICIRDNEVGVETGLRKLGSIIGDYAQIGCNAVLNPGTLIGKRVQCDPLSIIKGYVGENRRVKAVQKKSIYIE